MKVKLFFPLLLVIFSCSQPRKEESLSEKKPLADSNRLNPHEYNQTSVKTEVVDLEAPPIPPESLQKEKLIVADRTKYSKKFLDDLIETPEGYQFDLKDSVMMIVGQGEVIFPSLIALNQKRKFTGKSGDKTFDLIVGRLNYSTIAFELRIYVNGKSTEHSNGTADISSMFFLASEIDEDDKTGTSYSSYEYYSESKDCDFSVRIGVSDEDGKLRAKVKRNCTDKSKNISLNDCPTLTVM